MRARDEDPGETGVFRPRLPWRLCTSAAGGSVAVLLGWMAVRDPDPLILVKGVLGVLVGGVVAVRAWIAEVSFSRDELRVVGVVWTRTIVRRQILQVDTDGYSPCVYWRTPNGRGRMTPLTVLARGGTILPARLFSRGEVFLHRLSSWAD